MAATAADVLEALTDPGSWAPWDSEIELPLGEATDAYLEQRRAAAQRSGVDESILTGCATICGTPVALVIGEFGYLADRSATMLPIGSLLPTNGRPPRASRS